MEAIPQADEHEQRKHLVLKLVDLCETERQKGFYLSNLIEEQNPHPFCVFLLTMFRIRIGSGLNQVRGPGTGSRKAKMIHKNTKSLEFSCFHGCSLLRAECFSCSLDVPEAKG